MFNRDSRLLPNPLTPAAEHGRHPLRRLAFDLDETLGVPVIEGAIMVGWQLRPGCADLLDRLKNRFELVLWSVSPRRYVDKAIAFGLGRWFDESHSWDEVPSEWKDVRRLSVDWLVDDSPHHSEAARRFNWRRGTSWFQRMAVPKTAPTHSLGFSESRMQ